MCSAPKPPTIEQKVVAPPPPTAAPKPMALPEARFGSALRLAGRNTLKVPAAGSGLTLGASSAPKGP